MSHPAVTLEELLGDFNETAAKWKAFFAANPGAAGVETDIAKTGNVGALVWHMYSASTRHAERLLGEPVSDYEGSTPVKTLAGAWDLQVRAAEKLRTFLKDTNEAALNEVFHFKLRIGGEMSGSRRKLCLHVFVHAIRHWAQIGTLVRQHGFQPEWPQDIIFSSAIR